MTDKQIIEINIKIPSGKFTCEGVKNLIERTISETVNAYKEVNVVDGISVEEFKKYIRPNEQV